MTDSNLVRCGVRQLGKILRSPVKANDDGEIELSDFQIEYLKSLMPVLVDKGLLNETQWMGIPLRRIEGGKGEGGTASSNRTPDAAALTRLSVNMNADTTAALKSLADRRGISYTETVRRAISLLHYLDGQWHDGNRMIVRDERAGVDREVIPL